MTDTYESTRYVTITATTADREPRPDGNYLLTIDGAAHLVRSDLCTRESNGVDVDVIAEVTATTSRQVHVTLFSRVDQYTLAVNRGSVRPVHIPVKPWTGAAVGAVVSCDGIYRLKGNYGWIDADDEHPLADDDMLALTYPHAELEFVPGAPPILWQAKVVTGSDSQEHCATLGVYATADDARTAVANWVVLQGEFTWMEPIDDAHLEQWLSTATVDELLTGHFAGNRDAQYIVEKLSVQPHPVLPTW